MKETLLLFIFTTLFISCNKENQKSDFIGNWSSISDENFELHIDIEFFKDSMVIDTPFIYGTYSNEWKVIDDKIEQTLLRGNSDLNYKNTNYYKFNSTKDTLFIKNERDSIHYYKFSKITNGYEYFENKIGIVIKLPHTSEKLISLGNKEFNFNIYLGKNKDSLIMKTDNIFSLKKLRHKVSSFYFSKKEVNLDSLKFVLYADKSILENELDSIKTILKQNRIKKIFRIYDNEKYIKNNWKSEINWLGKYEN